MFPVNYVYNISLIIYTILNQYIKKKIIDMF